MVYAMTAMSERPRIFVFVLFILNIEAELLTYFDITVS